MNLPIDTFLDTAKVDELDQSFFSSMNNGQYSLLRDHIDMNEFIESGYITYIADSITNGDDITKSVIKRNIISKYFDGNSKVRIVKKEETNEDLKCQSKNNLFSIKILENQRITVSPLPSWTIRDFPNDWKNLSKQYQKQYINGGSNPTFSSWRAMNINHGYVQSIILIDRYFLSWTNSAIINTEKILEGLINEKGKSEKIHLTIVTMENSNFGGNKEHIYKVHGKMVEKLKVNYPHLSLTILYVPVRLYHDRYLLTDFYFIHAGGGYILYDQKGVVNRPASNLISHFPISSKNPNDNFDTYLNALNEVYGFIKQNKLVQSAGEIDNMLFRVLQKE
jgi:hypothetical protein